MHHIVQIDRDQTCSRPAQDLDVLVEWEAIRENENRAKRNLCLVFGETSSNTSSLLLSDTAAC